MPSILFILQGMLGKKDSGRLRAAVKKEVSLLKKQKKGSASVDSNKFRQGMNSVVRAYTSVSGLSTSLSFTPVQGIELANPSAASNRAKEANNKWFDSYSGFMSAAPGR